MSETLSQAVVTNRPEHKFHLPPTVAKRLLGVSLTVSGLFLPGCSRLAMDPSINPDAYYATVDRSVARAMDQVNQQAMEAARNEYYDTQSASQKPVETQEPQAPNLTTDALLCATVAPGGSISQAVKDANKGEFPPYDVGGLSMLVGYFQNGKWVIERLDELMSMNSSESPPAYPGDTVCISPNANLLEQQPTPSK